MAGLCLRREALPYDDLVPAWAAGVLLGWLIADLASGLSIRSPGPDAPFPRVPLRGRRRLRLPHRTRVAARSLSGTLFGLLTALLPIFDWQRTARRMSIRELWNGVRPVPGHWLQALIAQRLPCGPARRCRSFTQRAAGQLDLCLHGRWGTQRARAAKVPREIQEMADPRPVHLREAGEPARSTSRAGPGRARRARARRYAARRAAGSRRRIIVDASLRAIAR